MRHFIQSATITLAIAAATGASISTAQNSRHAGAHVHGQGVLNFAIDGQRIHLEITAPGFDILGFETISSEQQHQKLEQALKQLKDPGLWSFPAKARCQWVSAEAHVEGLTEASDKHKRHNHKEHEHEHKEHEHKEHEHKEHEHKEHEHKEHEHKEHEHKHGGHMNISTSFIYQCQSMADLNSISTRYFATFPRSKKLTVQGITADAQVSGTLSREHSEVRF